MYHGDNWHTGSNRMHSATSGYDPYWLMVQDHPFRTLAYRIRSGPPVPHKFPDWLPRWHWTPLLTGLFQHLPGNAEIQLLEAVPGLALVGRRKPSSLHVEYITSVTARIHAHGICMAPGLCSCTRSTAASPALILAEYRNTEKPTRNPCGVGFAIPEHWTVPAHSVKKF